MKIYLWNDRTGTVVDDRCGVVTVDPDKAGFIRINGDERTVRTGDKPPEFGLIGRYHAVFVTDGGISYDLRQVVAASDGVPYSMVNSVDEILTIKRRTDELEDLCYKLAREIGEVRGMKLYDSKGVFHAGKE